MQNYAFVSWEMVCLTWCQSCLPNLANAFWLCSSRSRTLNLPGLLRIDPQYELRFGLLGWKCVFRVEAIFFVEDSWNGKNVNIYDLHKAIFSAVLLVLWVALNCIWKVLQWICYFYNPDRCYHGRWNNNSRYKERPDRVWCLYTWKNTKKSQFVNFQD